MPRLKLTQAAIERLKPPPSGRIEYWDAHLPGFGLRISALRPGSVDGRRTWQVMYRVNGRLVRETIGTVATIPKVEIAREKARASLQAAQAGTNPVEARRRKKEDTEREAEAERALRQNTLSAVIDRYLEEAHTGRNRKKPMGADYYEETKRTLNRDVRPVLGDRPITEIARGDIRELLAGIVDRGAPSGANHVLAYTRALFNWAVADELIAKSPAERVKMPAPRGERDRILDDDEIRLFWRACDKIGWPFGPFDQLLLLTAQRRDELAEVKWPELDIEAGLWRIPGERTKNGREHYVHLAPLTIEIIGSLPRIASKRGFVFTTGRRGDNPISGWSNAANRLCDTMADLMRSGLAEGGANEPSVPHFTRHDLRRTAASGMARLGVAPHVVDKILNHTTGKISGVAAIYNRFEYLPERKAATEAWSRHIESLIRPRPSNVVDFAAAR
jgi:integrase